MVFVMLLPPALIACFNTLQLAKIHAIESCAHAIFDDLQIVIRAASRKCILGGGGGGGGGDGPGSFVLVQLRGVRRCREVVGLTVGDVVLLGGLGVCSLRIFFRDGCSEIASSPGHTQLFQCCTLKNGRAWYLNDIIDNGNF